MDGYIDTHIDLRGIAEIEAKNDSRDRFYELLGPVLKYLKRPDVYNANVNEGDDGAIFVEAAGGKFQASETMSRADRRALIGYIASKSATAINDKQSRLAADMPHDFDVRVQAFCPPVSDWCAMFRKHAVRVFSIDEYAEPVKVTRKRTVRTPERGLAAISSAVARGDNIIVAGKPGAGKTTFLNAILEAASRSRPLARLVVVQDRKELKPSHADRISLLADLDQSRYEDGRLARYTYEFAHCLKDMLRTDFDMLAWGELRDYGAAMALLMALNTGVRGLATTLHADSALDGLYRLEDLLRSGNALPPRRMIARFVDLIVFMDMDEARHRQIGDVVRVFGVDDDDDYILESVAA